MNHRHLVTAAALLALAGSASAQQPFISEIFINPPGSPDSGRESIEITGQPNQSLAGFKLVIVEGDILVNAVLPPLGQRPAGTVDVILDLSAYTLGSNGVLLIRDTTRVLEPAPASGTNVVIFDFNPDLENGGNTFLLGSGPLAANVTVGLDLDPQDTGTLGSLGAGFNVTDAVAYVNGDEDGVMYAAQFGGFNIPRQLNGANGPWTPDALYRILNSDNTPALWAASDILTIAGQEQNGPYYIDDTENYGWGSGGSPTIPSPNTQISLDLGSVNFRLPAPVCYANCDQSTTPPVLNAGDFSCFLTQFRAAGSLPASGQLSAYANCDQSTTPPVLNAGDFGCFLQKFRAGCP
jgi:hypothetical protein